MITPIIDQTTGQIGIALSSSIAPITSSVGGSLVTIDFHPTTVSSPGLAAFQLVASASPNGQYVATELEDAQGTFTLTPAPSNGFNPAIDGVVTLLSAAPAAVHGDVEIAPLIVVAAPPGDGTSLKEDSVTSQTPPLYVPVSAPQEVIEEGALDVRQTKGHGDNAAHLADSFFTLPAAFVLASSPFGGPVPLGGGSFLPGGSGLRLPDWLLQQALARALITPAADALAPFAGMMPSPSFASVFAVNPHLAATVAPEGLDSLLWDDLSSNLDWQVPDNPQDSRTRGDTLVY
jgi:hypothetical protein